MNLFSKATAARTTATSDTVTMAMNVKDSPDRTPFQMLKAPVQTTRARLPSVVARRIRRAADSFAPFAGSGVLARLNNRSDAGGA